MKIRKDDNVIVLSGKDKGKTGKVLRAFPREGKVIVEGVHIVKKHQKKTSAGAGQVVDKTLPVDVSNVAVIDPKTKKATRVGYKTEGGKKVRITRASKQTL